MAAPWVAAAVQGGTGLGGTGISAWSAANQNRKNRQFALDQYGRELTDQYTYQVWRDEREDSVWQRQNSYDQQMWDKQNAHNQRLWEQQNQYDSPSAQMQRFRDAGLNPHLIYGQMGNGGSIATAQMDTSATGHSSGTTPHASHRGSPIDWSGLGSSIQSMWDVYQQQVTTDNLKKAGQLADEEIALRQQQKLQTAAQTDNILANTETSKYNLGYQQSIRDLSTTALQESNRGLKIQNDLALQKNERDAALNASNIREAAERVLNMRGQRVNTELDSQLKSMDVQMKSMGIQPGDAIYLRWLSRIIQEASNSEPAQMLQKAWTGENGIINFKK